MKTLPAGATPIDFAYAVHTDVGHRTVGAKVNGRIVPLHYRLKSGDFVEILTAKSGPRARRATGCRSPRRRARATRSAQWFSRETREETEQKGREALEQALKAQNLPYKKLAGLGRARAGDPRDRASRRPRTSTSRSARGSCRRPDRQQGDPAAEDRRGRRRSRSRSRRRRRETAVERRTLGINVEGVEDVLVRLAKCCTPVPGDEIVGYISLGKGITIHRERLPEREGAAAQPGAVHAGRVGRRRAPELPRPDRRRLVGPPAPARGRCPDVRRARREHRLLRRRRRGSDGAELVHGRGRRREGAARRCSPRCATSTRVFDAYRVTPS